MRTSRMTRAAAGLIAGTAVATALLPAAIAPARPKRPPRPPRAHAAGITLGVSSLPVDAITATSAVLRTTATVSLLGADVAFQYGPTTSYGSSSKSKRTSLVGLAETITIPITALTPSTTYHFRPVIWSGSKAVYGRDQWFTTTAQGAAPGTTDQGQDTSQPDTATTGDEGSDDHGGSGSGSGDSGSTGGSGDGGSDSATTTDPSSSTDDAIKDKSSSPSGDTGTKSGDSSATKPDDVPAYTGPRPVLGELVGVQAIKGTVTVLSPSGEPVDVGAATALPTGTIVDTTRGTVALTSATDGKGATQTGKFWGGVFEVRQSPAGHGVTQLVLRGGDFTHCPASSVTTDAAAADDATATAAAGETALAAAARATLRHTALFAVGAATKSKPPRRLWGSDKNGRFQTRGRGSVATVRGTRWSTEDWCQGTITRVTQGAVSVLDLHRKRSKLVKHGHSYFAQVGDH